jgi:hypothetical protein
VNANSLVNNTQGFKESISPSIKKFQPIVTMKNLYFQNKIFDNIKDFGFFFHYKNPGYHGMIIHKSKKKSKSSNTLDPTRAPNISMHKSKGRRSSFIVWWKRPMVFV